MNKKGLSLFELIAALVIMSLVFTLSAFVISSFIQANERVTISAMANEEGNYASRKIEVALQNLNPNTYDNCPGATCYIFYQEFAYEINEVSEEIELIIYDVPLSYKLQIIGQVLYINDVAYDFEGFTLDSSSSIELTDVNGVISLSFTIVLESEKGDLFEFLTSYSFEELNVPDA